MTVIGTDLSWRDRARSLAINGLAFIDGKYVAAASGEQFDCVSPIDGKVIAKVASTDEADVDRAVSAARRAFEVADDLHGPNLGRAGDRSARRPSSRSRPR